MKKLVRWLLSSALIAISAPAFATGCEGLPPPSHGTIFESAQSYATGGEQSLSEDGIVLYDYKNDYNNLGKWPNPFFNAQYALALYRDWLDTSCSDDELKTKFLHHAEWLKSIAVIKDGMAVWTYPFRNTYFHVDAGWYSGIGQAVIAGALFRAAEVGKNPEYMKLGQQALEVYFRPASEGGVVTTDGDNLWIQEVPTLNGKPFNILNGHITAIFSLIDIRDMSGEGDRISALIKRAIDTVRNDIPSFDAGFTSFYSQDLLDGRNGRPADRLAYNILHTTQLLKLYSVDGDPIFLDWAMRFQAYDETDDARTSSGSTDPAGHGPSEAAGFYGYRYWSNNEFPTWYEISLAPRAKLEGIYLEGQTQIAMAKDFTLSTYLDGALQDDITVTGNKDKQLYYRFKEHVLADKIRLDIRSDNGNGNVAMVAIMPIRVDIERAPVADWCNHRVGSGRYLLWDAFDRNDGTPFTVNCDGYILLPKLKANGSLSIKYTEFKQPIPIKVSDDLKTWRDLGEIVPDQEARRKIAVPAGLYARIDLSASMKNIDGIEYQVDTPATELLHEPFVPGFRNSAAKQ